MRNCVKFLIGLAMPGLALAALWLWTTRRERQHDSNHGNDTEMARELRDVAEELKIIRHKRCANHVAPKILDFNGSAENDCCEPKSNLVPSDSSSMTTGTNSKVENINNANEMVVTQEALLENSSCTEMNSQVEPSNTTNTESFEFSRNSRMDNHGGIGNPTAACGEMHHRSDSPFENGSSQDSKNTKNQNEGSSTILSNNNSDTQDSHSKCVSGNSEEASDSQSSEIASVSQENENISKLSTKAPTSRTQSLDEYSDVSSTDSPLEQKMTSTVGSDCEPAQPEDDTAEKVTWEVEFPQALCGRLIGKKGKNVQKISQITGTKIRLIPLKVNTESSQRLVALTGSAEQLKLALRALREKFPSVPFTPLNGSQPYVEGSHGSPTPNITCVTLPDNELCQVFVTNIVDANHFYVQLYDHSTHNHLRHLDQQMHQCYGGVAGSMVPQSINTGMLCAAITPSGWWWRAQVVGLLMKPDEVEITWLDYGGRTTVPTAMLRQLRSEFLPLAFQAVECYLSNVVPNHGEPAFSMAACALFEELTQNVILTARITGYTKDCPNLELYVPDQWTGQPLFVNREFVRRGFARWSET